MESKDNLNFLLGLEEYVEHKGDLELKEKIHQLVNIIRSDNIEEALIRNFLKNTYNASNLPYLQSINNYIKKNDSFDTINDAFSRGQIRSKIWLATELKKIKPHYQNVLVMAGWMGQIVEILRQHIGFDKLRLIEIDQGCCLESDYNFNISMLDHWKVKSVNADINKLTAHLGGYQFNTENFKTSEVTVEKFMPNLIINTSSEHMSDEWYQQIRNKGWDCIVAIQSNNLFDHPDHINCVHSASHMMKKYPMKEVLYSGELQLTGLKRVMVIGRP